jgi:hypothetical protein
VSPKVHCENVRNMVEKKGGEQPRRPPPLELGKMTYLQSFPDALASRRSFTLALIGTANCHLKAEAVVSDPMNIANAAEPINIYFG